MQENYDQQNVGGPVVNISDQLPEWNIVLQVQDGFIGPIGQGHINEFEHQAGTEQQKNQHCSHAPQTPGQAEPEGPLRNRPRPEMQKQAPEVFPGTFLFINRFPAAGKNR